MYLVLCGLLCLAFACVLSEKDPQFDRKSRITSTISSHDEVHFTRASDHATFTGEHTIYKHGFQDGDGDTISPNMTAFAIDTNCPPLESLDFLQYNKSDPIEVQNLENRYPCELRLYWHSPNIQRLVSLVRFLFKYITIVMIITGLLVNIYSLFVLNSPPINKCNMAVYLKALAFSDIGAIIFNITVGVLRARFTSVSNFYLNNGWMCALHKILLSVFLYYSTWLIVTFTIERLLMIRNPFNIHTWQNAKPAKLAVVILAVITLGFENDNAYEYEPCQTSTPHKISIYMVPFVLINSIVPSILIIATNICLLINVRRSARDQSNLKATDDQTNTEKITRMLIVISISYVTLFLPIGILGCTELYYRKHQPSQTDQIIYIKWAKKMLLLKWIRRLCFFLYLLNYVNNFFLYCLSGEVFRQTVKVCFPSYVKMICPCLSTETATSRRLDNNVPPISLRTRTTSTTRTQRSPTHIVSETGSHNAVFSFEEEMTTHL